MFSKQTYIKRRQALKKSMKSGLILLFGNNDSSVNYPSNVYTFRQDSSFLYFFGQRRGGLVGVIDLDNDQEYLVGNDIDIEDIVWHGNVFSVRDLATQVGVENSVPMTHLKTMIDRAKTIGQSIHFLPLYRNDIKIQLMDLLGVHPYSQKEAASKELILAIVHLRDKKSAEEIVELDKASDIGYKMHTAVMRNCMPGVTELYINGLICGIASSYGSGVSFQPILSMHGEIMHGNPTSSPLEEGRLLLCDAGAETLTGYCSDNTRTMPVNGKFDTRQRDIYSIVEKCHDHTIDVAKPGVRWWDIHMSVCRVMTEELVKLDLMKGDVDEAVAAGAHALFMPHGLGHMMGMDVHDMEGLGQTYVGFDDETQPNLEQFGTNHLRCGRRMEEGFVMTNEPGIYFIPALIDEWRTKGINQEFINFEKLESFKDFGGIRIEDGILITSEGCRYLGTERIPYHIDELEEYMREHRK